MYIDGRLVWQCIWGITLLGEVLGSIKDSWRGRYVAWNDMSTPEKVNRCFRTLMERLIIMFFTYNFVMSLRND